MAYGYRFAVATTRTEGDDGGDPDAVAPPNGERRFRFRFPPNDGLPGGTAAAAAPFGEPAESAETVAPGGS